jgi:uncharacterized membrane protein YfcA
MIPIPDVAGINVLLLILLGFVVGVLGGFFGVGGTWIVTPGLNLLGLPIAFAVGTDLLHTMGKSIVATIKHRRFGHVDVRLGAFMILGTALGLKIGEITLLRLEAAGTAESVVRIIYIVILFFIAGYVLWDYRRAAVAHRRPPSIKKRLYEKVQALRLPPYLSLPTSGIPKISAWVPFAIAFMTGVASGLLGVGAGFIRMPSLVYILGVPTKIAVGTDLFEIIFSAGIGAFLYTLAGRTIIAVAAVMLVGAALGAQVGTLATQFVKGLRIRLYFGLSVLLPAVALTIKEAGKHANVPYSSQVSVVMLIGAAVFISLIILRALVQGILEARYYAKQDQEAGAALAAITEDVQPPSSGGRFRRGRVKS